MTLMHLSLEGNVRTQGGLHLRAAFFVQKRSDCQTCTTLWDDLQVQTRAQKVVDIKKGWTSLGQ